MKVTPRRSLAWALLVFLLLAPALYWALIFLPHLQRATPGRMTSNLYPPYVGIRETVRNKRNPYSDDVTREIQIGYYGKLADPEKNQDQERFAYPATLIVVLAPIAFLPFRALSIGYGLFALLAIPAAALLWSFAMDYQRSRRQRLWLAALVLGSWPATIALGTQQLTILFALLLAAAAYAHHKGAYLWSGVFLACACLKPQLAWPFVVALCLLSFGRKGSGRFLGSFVLTNIALIAAAYAFLPGWIKKWTSAMPAYMKYTSSKLPLQYLAGDLAGKWLTLVLLICAAYKVLKFAREGRLSFAFALAAASAIGLLCVPTQPWNTYNQLIGIPAVLFLCFTPRAFANVLATVAKYLILLCVGWSNVACALLLIVAAFHRAPLPGWIISAPVFLFALLPLFLIVAIALAVPATSEDQSRHLSSAQPSLA